METKTRLRTKDITRISLFAALITVCSWISIPFTIPFTMQTFGIFLALLILGAKKGTLSILVYILLGLIGLPVFAGFSSGVSALAGLTGGFIWGFILQGITYIILEKLAIKGNGYKIITLILSQITCYTSGVIWFANMYSAPSGVNGYLYAISICVVPYIIPDLLKLLVALEVSKTVNKAVN